MTGLQSQPKISILIPFYKADYFFDKCWESIVSQTYLSDEIIIVNDNSGDASKKYLQKFEGTAKVIHLETSHGLGRARNIAIKNASNDWIAFQDADDLWEPTKLERQIQYLQENPEWIGCHTGVVTFDKTGPKATYINKPSPLRVSDLLMGSQVTPPSLLIRKQVLVDLGMFDTNFRTSEDYEFSIRLAKSGNLLGFVPEPLIKVRRSNHGNLSSNGSRVLLNHIRLLRKHWDIFYGVGGANNVRRFLGNSVCEAGGKMGGVFGELVYRVGRIVSF